MKRHKRLIGFVCLVLIISCVSVLMLMKEEVTPVKHPSQKIDTVVPLEMTKPWYDSLTISVENPKLIETLNRSKYSSAFYTAGVEASIFLGRWLLTCEVNGIEPVPYFIELTDDVSGASDYELKLKQLKYLAVEEDRELLDVLLYKRPDELSDLTNELTLDRTIRLEELIVYTPSSRVFISGVNITGQTTTADVYLKILKNKPRLIIKNIVKATVDTTWIDARTFNVIN
ncbi:MAG: YfkD family protein [Bacillota bacterium]